MESSSTPFAPPSAADRAVVSPDLPLVPPTPLEPAPPATRFAEPACEPTEAPDDVAAPYIDAGDDAEPGRTQGSLRRLGGIAAAIVIAVGFAWLIWSSGQRQPDADELVGDNVEVIEPVAAGADDGTSDAIAASEPPDAGRDVVATPGDAATAVSASADGDPTANDPASDLFASIGSERVVAIGHSFTWTGTGGSVIVTVDALTGDYDALRSDGTHHVRLDGATSMRVEPMTEWSDGAADPYAEVRRGGFTQPLALGDVVADLRQLDSAVAVSTIDEADGATTWIVAIEVPVDVTADHPLVDWYAFAGLPNPVPLPAADGIVTASIGVADDGVTVTSLRVDNGVHWAGYELTTLHDAAPIIDTSLEPSR